MKVSHDGNPSPLSSSSQSGLSSRTMSPSSLIYAQKDEDPVEMASLLLKSCGFQRKNKWNRILNNNLFVTMISISVLLTLSSIGSIPRYCINGNENNCEKCPKNAICDSYRLVCVNNTIKMGKICHDPNVAISKVPRNFSLLIFSVSSLTSWVIVSILAILRQRKASY